MKAAERAARAELRRLAVTVGSSVLARTLIDLAKRYDAGPGDALAVLLSRELRLVSAELQRRSSEGVGGEAEAFLAAVSTPAFRGPGD